VKQSRGVRRALGRALVLVCAMGVGLLAFAGIATAATYTVNTTNDSSDGGSCATTCSLRDALTAANTAGGTNTIVVPSGIYVLTQGQLPQINNTNLTLTGAGARSTTINGDGASRIFDFTGNDTIAVSRVTVTDGLNTGGSQPGDYGGAIHDSAASLTLTDVAVTNSVYEGVDGGGGAIAADGNGTVALDRVTVSGNEASFDGGGIYMPVGTMVISVIDSTIAGNQVDASLSGNPSGTTEIGGGIDVEQGTLQLTNSTIADNTLAAGAQTLWGGGIFDNDQNGTTLRAANTIVAENSPDDCAELSQGGPPATSTGPNLDSDSTCFPGASDHHANPDLQSLYPNGGQTDTLALSAYSPAIDAGRGSTCPTVDQRGIARPQGAACDLGAYEATAPLVATGAATGVGADTATISGTANPDDQSAFSYFQYGTSTAYGFATGGRYVGELYGDTPLSSQLTSLAPDTTYHYRTVGVSAIGISYGADQTFTTAALPPTGTTPTATAPTPTLTAPATITPSAGSGPKCSIRLASGKVLLSARKSASRSKKPRVGTVQVGIDCDQAAGVALTAVVGEFLPGKPAWHRSFDLSAQKASAKAGAALKITLTLPRAALAGLAHRLRETVQFVLAARNANGATTERTKATGLSAAS
jgi:CSLREA domain-containing protein